jgi:hypothetical protein
VKEADLLDVTASEAESSPRAHLRVLERQRPAQALDELR